MKTATDPSKQPARLIIVDVENFAGKDLRDVNTAEIRSLSSRLRSCLQLVRADRVLVGCNPHWRFAVRSAWPNAEVLVRGGRDGADLALLERPTADTKGLGLAVP